MDTQDQGCLNLKYFDLFTILREKGPLNPQSSESRNYLLQILKQKCSNENWELEYEQKVLEKIENFTIVLSKLWAKSYRTLNRFCNSNSEWLRKDFLMPNTSQTHSSSKSIGRPQKSFINCSDRSKRRKIQPLVKSYTSPEIVFAAQTKIHQLGMRSASNMLKESIKTPNKGKEIKKAYLNSLSIGLTPYTADEGLAFLLDSGLTKQQYNNIRKSAKKRNANIYPSYDNILISKKKCYPENILISETSCKLNLQELLNHTIKRIFETDDMPIITNNMNEFEIICKWGCDGSSGHGQYKQLFTTSTTHNDSDLFLFSIVPLQIKCLVDNSHTIVLWQNQRTSSTRFCRPIKFEYKKETTESTIKEVNLLNDEIQCLIPTSVFKNNIDVQIKHKLIFSMIDGKVCNAISGTSSQKCYICKCSPKEMNDLEKVKSKHAQTEYYEFGLSTLHAWIRFMECLLHIAYRLDFKKWQARTPEDKNCLELRKKTIQDRFKNETGLLIDIVLQGKGSTNDGNTARRFFGNPEKTADITGLDLCIIKRFGTILRTMVCGYEINTDKFQEYALKTAEHYIEKYPWYYMPASVHKVLMHGAEVIKFAILPIGQLSEEAQEARNKDYRKIREHNTRKMSRLQQNEDLIHMLLISSDPYISSIRNIIKTKQRLLDEDIKSLITIDTDNSETSDSNSD